jgi:hypothetical protein
MGERLIRTRCVCGWESVGPVDEVVAATLEHGQLIHNMASTREQVLAQAEVVEAGDAAAAASSPGGRAPRG